MNLLVSLVPLETLPGWPAAPPVSVIGLLLLLVGFPVLMILVLVGFSAIRPAQSAYDAMQERQAYWVSINAPEAVTEAPGGGRRAISGDESSA
ncbi:MAG TPA: hypothetical protein VFP34_05205 [Microlunatus sp.]|nr:hypothetical protein [Microlunatus sp.]